MTKETLCTYEQAIGLKRLGFDWPCRCMFVQSESGIFPMRLERPENCNSGFSIHAAAPTHDVAHRWLRKIEELSIAIIPHMVNEDYVSFNFSIYMIADGCKIEWSTKPYETYDRAMSAALDKAIFCAIIINHNNK